MTRTWAKVLLIVFGNLLTVSIGMAFIPLIGLGIPMLFWAVAAAVLTVHVVGSVLSCRRFKRRFGISPNKYILCGSVPVPVIAVLMVMCMGVMYSAFGDIVYEVMFISLFPGIYSLIYSTVFAAAAGYVK